ncbi:MAG: GMP/IMP nucleotidase [Porticoccaceae bacterium]
MIDWSAIDTVLLDMDGTLLDLHFDNHFWRHHLPQRYAEHHGIDVNLAIADLYSRFEARRQTIEWYCTEFWSAELEVDICALKREVQHLIAERPGVRDFLHALGAKARTRILITNAHRHSLELKLARTGIDNLLDQLVSSHDYGIPKESPAFWHRLAQDVDFDPARTLFIDDTESVLVAARDYGVRHLICVRQPDSRAAARTELIFPAIDHFDDLLPVG